ncbi:MAG: antibiotic biosynthesis monooxygenase, partial [Mycobacterium sp.]
MYARSTTIEAQPSSIDAGIAHVRDVVMPTLQQIDGCVGVSLLVDRQSCRCIATSSWETQEAMHASAERVRPVRDQAAQTFGGSPTVDGWEIAVLHRDHHSGPG